MRMMSPAAPFKAPQFSIRLGKVIISSSPILIYRTIRGKAKAGVFKGEYREKLNMARKGNLLSGRCSFVEIKNTRLRLQLSFYFDIGSQPAPFKLSSFLAISWGSSN